MKLHIPGSVIPLKVNHPVPRNRFPMSPVFTSHPTLKPKVVVEQKKKP
jgi:hypothetical protein